MKMLTIARRNTSPVLRGGEDSRQAMEREANISLGVHYGAEMEGGGGRDDVRPSAGRGIPTTTNAEINGQCQLILLKRSLPRVPTVGLKGQGLLRGGGSTGSPRKRA